MQQVDVGPHYNFQSGSQAWHLTADAAGLIFIGITSAGALLEELKRTFSAKCGEKVAASRESELTAACKSLFKKLCAKYDDLASIDQLNKTMAKVEGVKMIMQENIEIAAQNCVSLEHIDKQAEDLQAQAGMFKTRAKVLRSKALIAVIVPLALKYGGSDDDDDKRRRRVREASPMSAAHHLSGLLCGLSVLPLDPPSPVSAALVVGVVVVLACTILFDPLGRDCLFRKLALYGRGGAQMVVGKDKKWKKKGRPDPARVDGSKDKRSKRVVFIRHGESEWNLVFNVGSKIWVPFKAVAALVRETLLFLRLDDGSVLYDSPLNESGLQQARDLDDVFAAFPPDKAGAGDVAAMADRDASVLATSNLRRAAQTEISTNIDTLSITPPHKPPVLPNVPSHLAAADRFDVSGNSGNKLLRGNGLQRMQAFAEWAFKRPEETIVVGGHSLFFRSFFREFLPSGANPADARDSKIANGGVVAFTLDRGTVGGENGEPSQIQYRVDPGSVVEVHLGFDTPAKKKAAKAAKKAAKKTN
ncbi:hypothetical protein JL721_7089 [Aureococcus anophagefferens]|nr:hypothetical protein JL721_7089 [Aureococcus anophagefferens]